MNKTGLNLLEDTKTTYFKPYTNDLKEINISETKKKALLIQFLYDWLLVFVRPVPLIWLF